MWFVKLWELSENSDVIFSRFVVLDGDCYLFSWVIRHLRKLFQVHPADYMLSVCGNDALRELSSPGKSGSFFYLTEDDRFIIKTVKKAEAKVGSLPSSCLNFYNKRCQLSSMQFYHKLDNENVKLMPLFKFLVQE